MDEIDACLNCTLPDCDENDPGCGRRSVRRRVGWADEIEVVGGLGAGERVVFGPLERRKARLLQGSIWNAMAKGAIGAVRTRRRSDLDDGWYVEVVRAAPVAGRRWGKWWEALQRCQKLGVGEEIVFVVPTSGEANSLQKAILAWRRGRRPGIATRRVSGGERLELHVRREG